MPIHNLIHLLTRQCYLRKQSNAVTDTDAYPHPDSSSPVNVTFRNDQTPSPIPMPIHSLIHLLTRQCYLRNQTPSPIPMPIHSLIHLLTRQCYFPQRSNAVTDTDAYP
jgi:hypothetical protein